MAANAAGLHNMLVAIGYTNTAALIITTEQGIDSIELLAEIDDREADALCNTM
jgi:hypothetical protein